MISNEWAEFLAYTEAPAYAVKSKRDNSFLGRFTIDMLSENYGFARVLTTLARGYLFHDPDGSIKAGDSYDRIDYARRALCAWCSIPDNKNAAPKKEWQFDTDYKALHDEFPELVDESGSGWYIRHLRGIAELIRSDRDRVGQSTHKIADDLPKLETAWRKKLIQFQTPIFSEKTKGDRILRFDDCIADALDLGALRREPICLTEKQKSWLRENTPKEVPLNVSEALLEYYLANKPTDSEWCVLPLTNIEAYLGSSSLSRLYMRKLNGTVLEKKDGVPGACVVRFLMMD